MNARLEVSHEPALAGPDIAESTARVVALDGDVAWLEPVPQASCSGCVSAGLCGTKSGNAKRMLAKRFALPNDAALRVGEQVVVGLSQQSLLRASAVAYGLPLFTMLGAMVAVSRVTMSDGPTILAALGGLAAGFGIARLLAGYLSRRGELTPHYLRRFVASGEGEACHPTSSV